MRPMSEAPLASRAVRVKTWLTALEVVGVAEARVGGWAPEPESVQVADWTQPVPVASLSVTQK
jgi:hypothetical protein